MARASRKPVEEIRLVYSSMISRPLGPDELDDIANRSQDKNQTLNLSGLLLLRGGGFHAVLEGPAPALLRLMETIVIDNRHRDIRILREEQITCRRFANWSFAVLPAASQTLVSLYQAEDFSEALSRRLR